MNELKQTLISHRKSAFWQKVVAKNLGLISIIEDPSSNVTLDEAKNFLLLQDNWSTTRYSVSNYDKVNY